MPIEVDLPDGSVAEFPDGTSRDVMKAAISKRFPAKAPAAEAAPQVPFSVDDGKGGQVNAYENPAELAKLDATHQATVADDAAQASRIASRTAGQRFGDTAAFAASLPVRMTTRGEYGAGDVAGLVAPKAGGALKQAEGDFVAANQGLLEKAAAAGDVMAGIPMLNSMGAVPGQVLRTGAAATRQLPGVLKSLARDTEGAGPIPGAASPPPAGAAPVPQAPVAARMPNRAETFAASDRLQQNLGAKVDIPEMVAAEPKQRWAAGLRSFPIAGDPIDAMYNKGLGQLEVATKTAGDTLGTPVGREAAGEGLKQGAFAWMGKNSKDFLASKYDEVYSKIDPAATRPLAAASKLVNDLAADMKESTGTAAQPIISKLKDAVDRPGGLTVKGQAALRSEVGDMLDESVINKSPNQRALKRAYGALTEDLKATIQQVGGTKALQAWEVANKEARTVAIKNKRLAKIVGSDENKLSGGDVFNKAVAIGQEKAGNSRAIDTLMDVVGDKQRGNFAAQMLDHMGMNPKTEVFSADRLLSEYNKFSDHAKTKYFGSAKPHLDDIVSISKKFSQLGSKFNHSNTGTVNVVLKVLGNPAGIAANVVTAGINPLSAFTLAGQGVALGVGRRMAWSLAKPSSAAKASSVLRSYYGVAKAAGKSAELVATKEEALARSVRAFSLEAARQTGAKADEIEANVSKALKGNETESGSSSWTSKPVSVDEMEAAIIELTYGREGASIAELRKKFPDVSKAEFNRTLKEMRASGKVDFSGKKE